MIRIITDSAADFEADELKEKNIICVPMGISFGEEFFKENNNLSKNEFYNKLNTYPELPKTSQPTPIDFENEFVEAKTAKDEAIVITVSSHLSGTYQSAVLIKNMTEYDDCYIIDSLSATGGQRILVDTAVKMRNEGSDVKEIAAELEALKKRICVYACVDTLEYLYKGGRLTGAAYAIGTISNVKPVIKINENGEVETVSKVIGRIKGIRQLQEMLSEQKPDDKYPMYALYTYNKENAVKMLMKLQDGGYKIPDNHVVNLGAAIGSHIGPNAFGLAYIKK